MSSYNDEDNAPVQPTEEELSDDGLWNEFENCAVSVTHLYRNSNWRTLQSAAASATQLYKHGLEAKKRSFERGYNKGRRILAREISTMCRYKNKVDVTDIVALLSKYDLLPSAEAAHHSHNHHAHLGIGTQSPRQRDMTGNQIMMNVSSQDGTTLTANPNAVFLFQEALAPVANPSASPHRNGLGNFLQNQVCRHRKRQHSPSTGGPGSRSPSNHAFEFVSKRFKRL